VFRSCREIVPHTNNSVTEELLTNVKLATLNEKCVAVATCYRRGRIFKQAVSLNVYLAKQYSYINRSGQDAASEFQDFLT